MKLLLMGVFSLTLLFSYQDTEAATKDYSDYTIHQLENMSFEKWWRVYKQYAKERGERVSESDKKDIELEYHRDGYLPDEAFDCEYGN